MGSGDFIRPHFMFATGIENSYPTIALPDGTTKRVDSMAKADHHRRWREDFEKVTELGIEFLRYGLLTDSGGAGTYPLIGTPERIASERVKMSAAGFAGTTVSFVNFKNELPYFIERVLPLLREAGLRVS